MYDYVDGKVDWMAAGLPVEGDDGPFLGDQVAPVPTCEVTSSLAEARRALESAGADTAVVVHGDGLAIGEVDLELLAGGEGDAAVLELLRPVPSTVRPSVTVASVAQGGGGTRLVTTADGRLLGQATIDADDHEGHDHEGHDHDEAPMDLERYEQELGEVMKALEERFGDTEASAADVHAFLRERLLAEGRSPEEADEFLAQLEGGEPG